MQKWNFIFTVGHHVVYGEPQPSQVSNSHGSTEVEVKALG